MKHEFLVIILTLVVAAVFMAVAQAWLAEPWQMVLVAVVVFLPLRIALYRYRRARRIKDPLDHEKWYWP